MTRLARRASTIGPCSRAERIESALSANALGSGWILPRYWSKARWISAAIASASAVPAGPYDTGLPSGASFRTLPVLRPKGAILSSSERAERRRRLLGLGATLLAALFVSLITTFARITYDAGSNPATQVFLRSLCMMLVLAALQLALGRHLIVPRRTVVTTIGLGTCILVMSFGYLSSVFYISVSLAVLVLYTYPLMVGIASLSSWTALTPRESGPASTNVIP
jgi:uncharacterized membrane protein